MGVYITTRVGGYIFSAFTPKGPYEAVLGVIAPSPTGGYLLQEIGRDEGFQGVYYGGSGNLEAVGKSALVYFKSFLFVSDFFLKPGPQLDFDAREFLYNIWFDVVAQKIQFAGWKLGGRRVKM